jgi:hypothetical protein
MRRILAGVVALAMLSLAAGGRDVGGSAHRRGTPAQICKAAVKAFARLSPPASLQDIPAGLDKASTLYPGTEEVNTFPINPEGPFWAAYDRLNGSGLLQDPTGIAADSIIQAVKAGDGPLANKLMAHLQDILAAIGRAQKKDKLPAACSSQAFGAAYFAPVAAVIKASLPLTANFTTDMNAACTRFVSRVQTIPALDLTDPSSVEDFITNFDQTFHALQVDAQTIAPPPGNPPAYNTLRRVLDQAVTKLDKAAAPETSVSQLRALGPQLTSLAQPISAAAAALGVTC